MPPQFRGLTKMRRAPIEAQAVTYIEFEHRPEAVGSQT